ncbi:MAG TPA: ABC transporter ATP-binding protein [Acidimicrobiales bacterium]|nr:ABC transporter ATP-binding protein [Acidimicrobiales bacterium]
MASGAPVVEVQGLVVSYGSRVAVDGVDLEAGPGEVVALLGRNGAGKTSTVEALEGYRRPAAGRVRVLGLDPTRASDHRRLTRRIGVMLQKGGVYPGMGPREAVELFASYYDHPLPPGELLDRLDLSGVERTPWRRLSGGEQQRLSLALALVGRPEVVFLDEPTAGVDPRGRLAIRAEVAALRESGVCVLLTTHELEEAERLADRIVIMDTGRVVAAGTTAELTASAPGQEEIRFGAVTGLDVAALGARLGAAAREERPGEYVVSTAGTPAAVAAVTAWLAERDQALTDLRTGSRLEEVFLRLTGEPRPAGAGERGDR